MEELKMKMSPAALQDQDCRTESGARVTAATPRAAFLSLASLATKEAGLERRLCSDLQSGAK